ncbi:Melibiase subfamily [Pelagicoccus albus]|uniref:Alpha-galactosidase n=1 Tax=Pelagicoccus albus TaxID=415222 RepID=A0A7X1E870_9BACT|nr:Melibiase subfamily [Pelagicoccus albus]MBC2606500.1 Melibiase subfamily [Pelagicoccus albus]
MNSDLLLYGAMALAVVSSPLTSVSSKDFHDWATTPPMGWNSWDNFATTVTEAQTKQQADVMESKLKAHGWEYVVVDIQWYEPGAESHAYRSDAVLVMDEYGRLQPAVNRFPSSENGKGFKDLAAYVHGKGLKFGVHLMRGIPRQAVEKNLPVFGTDLHAKDIANTDSFCPWNPDMYGVDMSKPGSQEYYDSVFSLFAEWGVDYVKVDDISRPYHDHEAEIEAIREAIDKTGRPMVLSLSPGATALSAAEHAQKHANLWRISDDFWDRWLPVREQFTKLANWNEYRIPGSWPDADMLPFGVLELGKRSTRFTEDEQYTVMTLWSIARSPLMMGGDLAKLDDFTLDLLTNDEVLAVNQDSENNKPLFENDDLIAWVADVAGSGDKYLAVFNARDRVRLGAEHADYVSETLERGGDSEADIAVGISRGTKLFLTFDGILEGAQFDHGFWSEPTLHFEDGTTKPLTDLEWSLADSLWDSAKVRVDKSGTALGIQAQAPARIFYDLPDGVERFTAKGIVESWGSSELGEARFLVSVARDGNESVEPGIAVPVDLSLLDFEGTVTIRDLWKREDLGEVDGIFSPVIPFHGAGLFRISSGE